MLTRPAVKSKRPIEKLTAAQESRLIEFREQWRAIGLSCEPADFAAGDEVIREFYGRLGKPAPVILHFSSPMMCELAAAWLVLGSQLPASRSAARCVFNPK